MAVGVGGEGGIAVDMSLMGQGLYRKTEERWETVKRCTEMELCSG